MARPRKAAVAESKVTDIINPLVIMVSELSKKVDEIGLDVKRLRKSGRKIW